MDDDLPNHRKFGYARIIEIMGIEQELVADGYKPKSMELYFAARREYARRLAGDPTLRQRQEAPAPGAGSILSLSPDEIEYLTYRLDGVNDPVGQGILEKLKRTESDG